MLLALVSIALKLLVASSPADAPPLRLVERGFYVMGSSMTLELYCSDEARCVKAVSEAHREVRRLDHLFSNYRSDSVLARVHAEARLAPLSVPKEFIELVRRSNRYSRLTGGAFDITAAPLYELWKSRDQREGRGALPTEEEISQARRCVGQENIQVSTDEGTVLLKSPCALLDFGAIGKGYAVDRVVETLEEYGISRGLVNFGGNIYAMEPPPGKRGWMVGVRDPRDGEGVFTSIEISRKGVATSGDYERYLTIEGGKYSHIIDPRTGRPASSVSSVSVVADTAEEADALSTAFSVMGREEMEKALRDWARVGVLRITRGEGGISVFRSESFRQYERASE